MTVYFVTLQKDKGIVVGVFSTQEKAAQYIADHPYNCYVLCECVVDKVE